MHAFLREDYLNPELGTLRLALRVQSKTLHAQGLPQSGSKGLSQSNAESVQHP